MLHARQKNTTKTCGADAGAGTGAGAVYTVQCVACSVLPAKDDGLAVEIE